MKKSEQFVHALDVLKIETSLHSKQINQVCLSIALVVVGMVGYALYMDLNASTPYTVLEQLVGKSHISYEKTVVTGSDRPDTKQYAVTVESDSDRLSYNYHQPKSFTGNGSSLDSAVHDVFQTLMATKDSTCKVDGGSATTLVACGTFIATDPDKPMLDLSGDGKAQRWDEVTVTAQGNIVKQSSRSGGITITQETVKTPVKPVVKAPVKPVEPKKAVTDVAPVAPITPTTPSIPPTYQAEFFDYDTRFTNLKSILDPLEKDFKDKKLDASVQSMYSTVATQYNIAREWLRTFGQAVALGVAADYCKGRLDTELKTAETVAGQLQKLRGVRY